MVNDPHLRPGARTYADTDEGPGARLTIGALSRATGIPIETLRTWEARYGFPSPERKPSGHRLYPTSYVERLRRVAEAIARGHRASTVVAATDAQLSAMLTSATTVEARYEGATLPDDDLRTYLDAVAAFDGDRLTHLLCADRDRLGLLPFLRTRLAPIVEHVGTAWHNGALHVRHEHFFTQRVEDMLRSSRADLEASATGPVVVFATLPGEMHALGLQMAALVVAAYRCRVLYLGTDTPTMEIADVARDIGARAVAISISNANPSDVVRQHIEALRNSLPRRVTLVIGGAGAHGAMGDMPVTLLPDFGALAEWAAGVAA